MPTSNARQVPAARKKRVQEAVARLRSYYRMGQEALREWRPGPRQRLRTLRTMASRQSVSDDQVRTALRLVDPDRGYTPKELDDLCRRIGSAANREGIPIGVAHVIKLMSFPRGRQRARMERLVLEQGWNIRRLAVEIAGSHGARKSGGRRPHVAVSPEGVMAQLTGLGTRWRRYVEALTRCADARANVSLDDLPSRVRRQVQQVGVAVDALQEEITREMTRRQPGWRQRVSRQDTE